MHTRWFTKLGPLTRSRVKRRIRIRPVPRANGCEYGILMSIEREEASRRLYESDLFQRWQDHIADYDNVRSHIQPRPDVPDPII